MNRNWKILIIGGSSGTGKTYLAKKLSEHYQIPFMQVDDIRLSMLQVADKEKYPDLFSFDEGRTEFILNNDKEFLVQKLEDLATIVWKGVQIVIANHLAIKQPIIIEGDALLPHLIATLHNDKIKSIFLYDDKEKIAERVQQRAKAGERNADVLNENFINKYADMSYAFGQKIKKQAETLNFPVLQSSPTETFFERMLEIV